MEIDLELPSGQADKLEGRSDTEYPLKGNGGLSTSENIRTRQEEADKHALELDAFGKGVTSYEPQKGLEFDSKEAAYSFYRDYARFVGFGITIKASRRSKKSGKFIDVKIACSRFGNKRESNMTANTRSCPKTDCKASMHMKRKQDGKWFIHSFVKEHNHEICPDDFYNALRGRSKQSGIIACQKKGLQSALDEVDVQLLMEYFMLMQVENPNFFYAVDLDQEKCMRNVFWIEAKSRHDYSNFCDVVFFDTSYVRNKYKVPFVPILGVNHHFQLFLIGCALIGEETTTTFVWLMHTWLRSLGGQTPKVIITDEGKSLEEAIREVFPDTRHCFCLWHVLGKVPENLSHVLNRTQNFMMKFSKCIHRSWTPEHFEKKWWKMVDEFDLREDEWLQSLYGNRNKWVPAYMSNTFLAGIGSTERSEYMSFFFEKYMHRETMLKDFIDQYKVFLHDKFEEEARADFETHHNPPALRSLSPFEKQMSTIYTHAIFKKFQVEVLGTVSCSLQKESEEKGTIMFQVDDFEEQKNFIVAWNEEDLHICCLCRSFEYRGYLCRHALIVLQISGVSNIPSQYILHRWTKDAKIRQSGLEISRRVHFRIQRFNELCKRAIKLGEEASLSQEAYNVVISALQEAIEHCVGVNNSVKCFSAPNTLDSQGFLGIEENSQNDNMGKASKKKKLHKRRKVQFASDVQDGNQQMGQLNPGAPSLDSSFVPQQEMLGMDVGSRTPLWMVIMVLNRVCKEWVH
ncbi:hypothetical protein NMG60_11031180 [Bertholletia excelsa]